MSEHVASDNPGVSSLRATISRAGSTSRPRLDLPTGDGDPPGDEIVRLVIDGRDRFAPTSARDGALRIEGAFDSARLARERTGRNRLAEWLEATDRGFGRTVIVDVVTPGYRYGLRLPGDRVVYPVREPPAESLRRIADGVDGGG